MIRSSYDKFFCLHYVLLRLTPFFTYILFLSFDAYCFVVTYHFKIINAIFMDDILYNEHLGSN